jgi:RNA polymerase sigma-70 factor (ECF subfamily)
MLMDDFESIVRNHQAMVFSIAYHFCGNSAIAEEIAQDVFLRLYETQPSVASANHLVSWLRRVTTHRCIDLARRRQIRSEVQLDELPDIGDDRPDDDPLLRERLRKLVESLPEQSRLVVILRYGEGLDPKEISEALRISVRAVWSQLDRGLALLRAKAARYLKEESHERVG